jgi:tetratricopeptide (TPR) repeat protein
MELTIEQIMQQAVAAHNQGNTQEAEKGYRTILQSRPTHAQANHNLGIIATSCNKLAVALPLFKTALEAQGNVEQFWISYIAVLIELQQFKNAKRFITKAKKAGFFGEKLKILQGQLLRAPQSQKKGQLGQLSDPPQGLIDNMLASYKKGHLETARNAALSITSTFPEHVLSWQILGAVLKQLGNIDDALIAHRKVVQLDPNNATSHNDLGYILRELGRLFESEISCRQAIKLKPDFAQAYNNLGNTLQDLEHYDEAKASYRQAMALKPNYAKPYSNLSVTLLSLGRLSEAEICSRQAITLMPNYADAHNNLGIALKELGRLDEAEISLRQAIALKPDLVSAMLNLAMVFNYMNNTEEAIDSYKKVLQLDPDNLGLSAGVSLAIFKFLEGDFTQSKKYLLAASKIREKVSSQFTTYQVFHRFLLAILKWHEGQYFDSSTLISNKTLYVIGESHSLVSHQLPAQHSGRHFIGKALLIEGCKQWHLGNTNNNQYKTKFERIIHALPKASNILLAIGEIDCRIDGGLIKHKNKYPEKDINELIATTVENYLNYVVEINEPRENNIIIQGVPCPNINTAKLSTKAVAEHIDVIKMFNYVLKNKSKEKGFGFLDLHQHTDRGDGFSNAIWHIDAYHISPKGMQEAWGAYA